MISGKVSRSIAESADKLQEINDLLPQPRVACADSGTTGTPLARFVDPYGVNVECRHVGISIDAAERNIEEAMWPHRQAVPPPRPRHRSRQRNSRGHRTVRVALATI